MRSFAIALLSIAVLATNALAQTPLGEVFFISDARPCTSSGCRSAFSDDYEACGSNRECPKGGCGTWAGLPNQCCSVVWKRGFSVGNSFECGNFTTLLRNFDLKSGQDPVEGEVSCPGVGNRRVSSGLQNEDNIACCPEQGQAVVQYINTPPGGGDGDVAAVRCLGTANAVDNSGNGGSSSSAAVRASTSSAANPRSTGTRTATDSSTTTTSAPASTTTPNGASTPIQVASLTAAVWILAALGLQYVF